MKKKKKIEEEKKKIIIKEIEEDKKRKEKEEKKRKEEEDKKRKEIKTNRLITHYNKHISKTDILNPMQENKLENASKLDDENKRCIICLQNYKKNDTTIHLPCLYFFHSKCIRNYLKNHSDCPLCHNIIKP